MSKRTNWRQAALASLATGGLVIGAAAVMNHDGGSVEAQDGQLRVGTYQPDRVFEAYPGRHEFFEQLGQLQAQAQQAEQQGDHQALMQIQQQFQEAQESIVQQFQDDVEAELPDLADEKGLDMVALEVVYTRDEIATEDITDEVIEAMGGEPMQMGEDMFMPPPQEQAPEGEQPEEPGFPPPPQQPEQQPQQQPEQQPEDDGGWGF